MNFTPCPRCGESAKISPFDLGGYIVVTICRQCGHTVTNLQGHIEYADEDWDRRNGNLFLRHIKDGEIITGLHSHQWMAVTDKCGIRALKSLRDPLCYWIDQTKFDPYGLDRVWAVPNNECDVYLWLIANADWNDSSSYGFFALPVDNDTVINIRGETGKEIHIGATPFVEEALRNLVKEGYAVPTELIEFFAHWRENGLPDYA